MMRTVVGRFVCWTALLSLAITFTTIEQPVLGADAKTSAKKTLGRRGHRLPAHYAQVVTEKQRAEIYKIQDEYRPKIDVLEEQLSAIKKERNEKIAAVLTAEQKKQLEEAAVKKHSKGSPTVKPSEETPDETPADTPAPAK